MINISKEQDAKRTFQQDNNFKGAKYSLKEPKTSENCTKNIRKTCTKSNNNADEHCVAPHEFVSTGMVLKCLGQVFSRKKNLVRFFIKSNLVLSHFVRFVQVDGPEKHIFGTSLH